MAGFRTFATGEVLTAANVNNFLMKQSVMVFADDAARTAALGAEVTEGMLTYNEDTAQLEVFDGSAFVPAGAEPPAGIGSNVVQTVKTDVFTTSSSTFVDVTGMSATITPSSATAKILIIVSVLASNQNASGTTQQATLLQITGGNAASYTGDTRASIPRATTFHQGRGDASRQVYSLSMVFVDAPATTSATTYAVQIRQPSAIVCSVNKAGTTDTTSGASSITVIEVAA